MQDKQKLFRLIRKLSTAEPCASPPRKSMPTSAVLQAVCASSLEATRARAQALDGDAALLDLEDADIDFFSQARAPILNCSFASGTGNLSHCGVLGNQTLHSPHAVQATVFNTTKLHESSKHVQSVALSATPRVRRRRRLPGPATTRRVRAGRTRSRGAAQRRRPTRRRVTSLRPRSLWSVATRQRSGWLCGSGRSTKRCSARTWRIPHVHTTSYALG